MQLRPGNAQWIGKRDEQQDAFAFAHIADDYFRSHGGALALVADGMGGMANGAQASRIAVQTFVAAYNEKTADEAVADALTRALEAANRAVWELAKDSAGEGQVGTTLVAAAVLGDQLYWVSAGDSRLYLYRADGSLAQCTTDHNLLTDLMEKVRAGEMTRDQALQHPDAEAVTSFLGMQRIERIDRNLRPLPLAAGDRLLLCSDGLFGTLDDKELAAVLAGDPQQAAETLLQQVQARADEYQDNTTILVLGVEAADAAAPAPPPRAAAPRRGSPWQLAGVLGIAALVGGGIWFAGRMQGPEPIGADPLKGAEQPPDPASGGFQDPAEPEEKPKGDETPAADESAPATRNTEPESEQDAIPDPGQGPAAATPAGPEMPAEGEAKPAAAEEKEPGDEAPPVQQPADQPQAAPTPSTEPAAGVAEETEAQGTDAEAQEAAPEDDQETPKPPGPVQAPPQTPEQRQPRPPIQSPYQGYGSQGYGMPGPGFSGMPGPLRAAPESPDARTEQNPAETEPKDQTPPPE